MRRQCTTLVLASLLLVARSVGAQGQEAPNTWPIGSFIDEQTVLVACVDLDRVSPPAITQWMVGIGWPAEEIEEPVAYLSQPLNALKGAGAHEVYGIVSLGYLPDMPWVVVVPLAPGADAAAIGALLEGGLKSSTQMHGAVCAGPESVLERLRQITPARQPLLERAFAEAGDGAVRVAAALTVDQRRVIEETMPELPRILSGEPSTILTRGALWASARIDLPPRPSAEAVVQASDEGVARKLRVLVEHFVEAVGRDTEVRRIMGTYDRVAPAFVPRVAGDRLVLSLDAATIEKHSREWFRETLSVAARERERTAVRYNVHNIFLACMMYAQDHDGEWPDELTALIEPGYIRSREILCDPKRPELEVCYAYRKPPKDAPPNMVVIYEKHDEWPASGVVVGYRDGAVDILKDEAEFKRMLQEGR